VAIEWLFAQLYPGNWSLLDRVVLEVVAPARRDALAAGADRWFFIRYIDRGGPHVRLRVRGDTDVINQIYTQWNETLRARMQFAGDPRPVPGADPEVLYAPYEPELAKYGGPVGTGIAETAFQASSESTLQLVALSPTWDTRRALTAHLMRRLSGCVAGLSPAGFWNFHHTFWTSAGVRLSATEGSQHSITDEQLRATDEDLPLHAALPALIDRLAEATATAIERALSRGVRVSAAHLLLHHLHMTVNRLGVLPEEELRIAQALRRPNRS
jgi:thiopeptide-type bacteriocin biosynthesis protein